MKPTERQAHASKPGRRAKQPPEPDIRELLDRGGLSQREAARQLGINERTMRRYCAGAPVPRYIRFALLWLVQQRSHAGGTA